MNRTDFKKKVKRRELTQEDLKKILDFSKFKEFIYKNKNQDPIIFYARIGYTKIFSFITKDKKLHQIAKEDLFSRPIEKGLSDLGYNVNLGKYKLFVYSVIDQETFLSRVEQDLANLIGKYHLKFNNTLLNPELKIDRELLVPINRSQIPLYYKSFLEEILS